MAINKLDIHIDDLATAMSLFDLIQVWKSTTELGTYAEATAAEDLPARLDGTVVGPWALVDLELVIVLNQADPVTVYFTGTDPLTIHDVITQINTLIPALAAESGTGTNLLRLTSPVLGTGSSMQVFGEAAEVLGLPLTKAQGKIARIALVSPTVDYVFLDYDGLPSDWYKTRYYSSVSFSVSAFSDPAQGSPQIVLPDASLSLATLCLADGAGRPLVDRQIIFIPMTIKTVVSGTKSYGIMPGPERIIVCTDSTGYAEIKLVRGQTFRVFFEGLAYEREFVVPNTTTFDVLAAISTTPDPFTIVQAPPLPIRVS